MFGFNIENVVFSIISYITTAKKTAKNFEKNLKNTCDRTIYLKKLEFQFFKLISEKCLSPQNKNIDSDYIRVFIVLL